MYLIKQGRWSIVAAALLSVSLLGTAGCGSSGSAAANPAAADPAVDDPAVDDPTPKATGKSGGYRKTHDFCALIDFTVLAAQFGEAGRAPRQEIGSRNNPLFECYQSFSRSGTGSSDTYVKCTFEENFAAALKSQRGRLPHLIKFGSATNVPGLGDEAFQVQRALDAASWKSELWLNVVDSNVQCELNAQADGALTPDQSTAALKALTDTARGLILRLPQA
ncbi:hypothetical protein [Kitasatospora sp. NPDC088351]|uniref:hypothetical protein n=1 Tax=Kitasatospora sp. NPDC088351 TaxID=3155180 RepID=UPI00342F162C